MGSRREVVRDLAAVLNKHSIDNDCNTPDFLLAEFLVNVLGSYYNLKSDEEKWHG